MVSDAGRDLSIALVGDVNFGAPIDRSNAFDLIRKDFEKFDVKFCNLEGCLFDSRVSLEFKPGWHHCDSANIAALTELKFNAVACANNVHFGAVAIRHSLALLDGENIGHAGAGSDRNEARKPAIFESGGIRFGMLAYTSIFWPVGHSATDKQAGVATIKIHTSYQPHRRLHEMPGAPATTLTYPDEKECEEMKNDIARLRSQVDVMVVYFHWGLSGAQELCQYQSTLGRSAIDSGADIVVGSHPHVVQGIEFYRGHPIFYSLGNFVFGSEFKPARGYRNGLVAILELRDRQIVRVSAVPCAINDREQPALLNLDQVASMALVEDIKRLSFPFGTKIVSEGNRLSLQTA